VRRLGFVGAGRMGRPMVRRLLEAQYQIRVLGRSAASRRSLAAEGAQVTADVAEVGAGADAVLVCVHSDEQVRQVCLGGGLLDGMDPGSILVIHTTASPRTIAAIAERAAPGGIGVIDAPVSGGPPDVEIGRLTLFVGGADDAVSRARPVLECYGDPVLLVGPAGAGQRVKLINNALFAAQIGLLSSAVRLGEQLGVDEAVLLSALPRGSAASRALGRAAARGSVASFAAAVGDFLSKDVRVIRSFAAEMGADLGSLDEPLNALSGALERAADAA
jgi:3-hydroxyisobutyrate dehydrogenase-like beta-hydroxyacid dehydrogenase